MNMWTLITILLLLASFVESNRLIRLQQEIEATASNISLLMLELMADKNNNNEDGDNYNELT